MITIGIVGAGGDGVVSIGEILLKSAAAECYYGKMNKIYDAVIKGGGSAVRLSLDSEEIVSSPELDLLVCLNWEQYGNFAADFEISAKTFILSEKDLPPEIANLSESRQIVPFGEIVKDKVGEKLAKNVLIAGLLSSILGLSADSAKSVISRKFSKKPEILEKNLKAFEIGREIDFNNQSELLELKTILSPRPKIIIHGNEAMVLAALRAGCKFYAGYPITPASEIMELMMNKLTEVKGVFIQSEDEIAALAMVIGSSFAGGKAMTATSGPGFSLMTEMLGLAIGCEMPVVIVNVQRGGPSTGMPTKSEQSDLNQAVYGGHGDGPRVVLAPYDLKSCFRLTIEAFNIAEHYQTPVIILSDQHLAQTVCSVDDFTKEEFNIIEMLDPSIE